MFDNEVVPGPILFMALEDPPRRLQDRMRKQGWPTGLNAHFLTLGKFFDSVGDLRNGGADRLALQIEREGYKLVVIDTLSRAVIGSLDQCDVGEMTQWLSPIQEAAHEKQCAVKFIDHHNKMSSFNAVTDILGSTAKGAMADTIWGLYRESGKPGAKLAITGRDIEEKTLALFMDPHTGIWQYKGDAEEVEMTERQQEILDAIKQTGRAKMKDITDITGQAKGNAHARTQNLVNAGKIKRLEEGKEVFYELT